MESFRTAMTPERLAEIEGLFDPHLPRGRAIIELVAEVRRLSDLVMPNDGTSGETLAAIERRVILRRVDELKRMDETAKSLGIGARTLWGKLHSFGYPLRRRRPVEETVEIARAA